MAHEFFWDNTESNELWHVPSKVIIAQVFKHEKDPVSLHQTWKLLLPWHQDPLIFDRRTMAKKWGLEAAKDYAEKHFDGVNWTPGNSPAEAREASRERKERVEAKLAARKAREAVQ